MDIGLLDRIVRMDEDQARAVWELLHNISQKARSANKSYGKRLKRFLGKVLLWHKPKLIITIMSDDKEDTYE